MSESNRGAIAAGLVIGIIAIASGTGYWYFVSQNNSCNVGKTGLSCASPPSASSGTSISSSGCLTSTTTGMTTISSSEITTLGTTCIYPPSISSSTSYTTTTTKSCPWYWPYC